MKKINFKKIKVIDLSEKIVENFKAHEVVGNILATRATTSPVRSIELARKIFKDGIAELPSEDVLLIRNAVLECQTITDIAKAAIITELDKPSKD